MQELDHIADSLKPLGLFVRDSDVEPVLDRDDQVDQ